METKQIVTLVFYVFMLISSGCFVYGVLNYMRKYRILQSIWAKMTGDVMQYDRIRRAQMRDAMEKNANAYSKKEVDKSLLNKIYSLIAQTGITTKIPEFSESGFIAVVVILDIVLLFVVNYFRGIVTAIISAIAFFTVVWYILSLIAYSRKIKLEKQLLQFINACSSASLQYTSIIDIFGAIYDQFSDPLREGLESCYVEAKQHNDVNTALKNLKNKYNSTQFSFIIDNLQLCSSITGDYHAVAKDISEMVSIFSISHEKKRALLKNAKMTTLLMFGISLLIMYGVSMFMGGLAEILLETTVGNILGIAMILILFYGLNIKTEE